MSINNKSSIRNNYNGIRQKAFDKLQIICDDYDFLVCTMADLDTEEKAQKMIDFLNYTKTTDTDEIIPYSIKIDEGLV